jgi:uncharacterized membrane protein
MKAFAVGVLTFLALDFAWLGFIGRGFYAAQLGPWLRKGADGAMAPLWTPAVAFYLLAVLGLSAFVLPRVAAEGGSPLAALRWGALFGLVVYSCWDLTNYSVLKDWPLPITLVDLAWGTIACALTATAMSFAAR